MDQVHHPGLVLLVNRQLFSNGALKAMILPLLIERLLQLVVDIVDTMMVSCASEVMASGVLLYTAIYTIFIYSSCCWENSKRTQHLFRQLYPHT